MDAILDAARALLVERGVDGFTTNAIAERAGINIATLYGYFSDKLAILHELTERCEQQRSDYLAEVVPLFEATEDWRPLVDATIDQLVRFRRDVPGAIELRQAIVSIPELRHLETESDERASGSLTDALAAIRPDLARDQLRGAARAVIVAGSHVLDVASEGDEIDHELLDGFRAMVRAHLERVLD